MPIKPPQRINAALSFEGPRVLKFPLYNYPLIELVEELDLLLRGAVLAAVEGFDALDQRLAANNRQQRDKIEKPLITILRRGAC